MSSQRWRRAPILIALLLSGLALLIIFVAPPPQSRPGPDVVSRPAPDATFEGGAEAPPAQAEPRRQTSAPDRPRSTALRLVRAVVLRDETAGSGVFTGQIVSWSTGEGIARAELTFGHGGVIRSILSNEAGDFRFEPAEPGAYELALVTAEGFLPFAPEWGHSPIRLLARPGYRVEELTITLRPEIDYQGLVHDPEGHPVAGAQVHLQSVPGGQTELLPLPDEFRTDEAGGFVFHAPDDALLIAEHPSFSPGRARLDTAAQISHRLVIRLGPPGEAAEALEISGAVHDAEGAPVEGALVLARYESENAATQGASLRSSAQAVSDGEGRFSIEGLDEGRYRVTANREGYAPARAAGVIAGTAELDLELTEGASLRGRVFDANGAGEAVSSFSVVVLLQVGALQRELSQVSTVIDPEGRYEIQGLAPGDYALAVTAQGFAPSEPATIVIEDPPPTAPLELDFGLERGGRLRGQVIDSESRSPLPRARVSVESALAWASAAGTAVPLQTTTTTDETGRFELGGLIGGLRSVFVAAQGHHARIISGLEVAPNGDIGPLTIDLRPVAEGEEPRLELTGIGAVLTTQGDALVIGRTLEGGGAAEAGLTEGDAILEVDGESVVDLGFQGSIERIRGPEGSTVQLTVRRAETGAVEQLTVARRRISA